MKGMTAECIELHGQRASLVPMRIDHVEELFAAGSDPQIWTYMPQAVQTLDDMKRLVEEALAAKERGEAFPFVIIGVPPAKREFTTLRGFEHKNSRFSPR
ncbi:GNAT family N-acetyltransferase [Aneurinibacillus sp. BA2021]|nr:GNAT family N-acetyltransferase [Aneurinibacillus sp. BA2021]